MAGGGDSLNVDYPSNLAAADHLQIDNDTGSIDILFTSRLFRVDYDEVESTQFLPF